MSAATITFEVPGVPAPQGSKRHVGGGRMVESSKSLASWRDSVAWHARTIAGDTPWDAPLALDVQFRFPMPASRSKRIHAAGIWPKTTAPDTDKLVRAIGDAMEAGGLIRSDALIHRIAASKVEVVGWTGAVITLTETTT